MKPPLNDARRPSFLNDLCFLPKIFVAFRLIYDTNTHKRQEIIDVHALLM